jgi:hypothetical protein
MSVFEELLNYAMLEVVVPAMSVQFPDESVANEWLSDKVDRKLAGNRLSSVRH